MTIVLGRGEVSVTIDASSGGITSLTVPSLPAIAPTSPSHFVLEVPVGGNRTVVVRTADQRLTSWRADADGSAADLRWEHPVTDTGVRSTDVRVSVAASSVTFAISYDLVGVEAVRFPSFDGITTAAGERLDLWTMNYSSGVRTGLLPVFANNDPPYCGTLHPDYASGQQRPEPLANPTSPFAIIAGERGGVVLAPTQQTQDFIGWRLSLVPVFADTMLRTPAEDATVAADVIQIPVSGQHVVPITLTAFDGPWTNGLDVQRSAHGPTLASPAAWLHEPHSWFQVQLPTTCRASRSLARPTSSPCCRHPTSSSSSTTDSTCRPGPLRSWSSAGGSPEGRDHAASRARGLERRRTPLLHRDRRHRAHRGVARRSARRPSAAH